MLAPLFYGLVPLHLLCHLVCLASLMRGCGGHLNDGRYHGKSCALVVMHYYGVSPPWNSFDPSLDESYASNTRLYHVIWSSAQLWWLLNSPDCAALADQVSQFAGSWESDISPGVGQMTELFVYLWCRERCATSHYMRYYLLWRRPAFSIDYSYKYLILWQTVYFYFLSILYCFRL